jgi:hypothetical protein
MSKHCPAATFVILSLALASCGTPPQEAAFVAPEVFPGFRPLEQALAAGEVDPSDGKAWKSLSPNEIRERLPNRMSSVMIERQNADGSVVLASAPVTAAPGAYTVVMDQIKYATARLDRGPDGQAGFARIGVGIRIRAQVVTLKENLNLGSLLAIGTAARAGDLTGSLSFDLIGVDATDVALPLPLSAEIQEESLRAALAAINAIEDRLGDAKVRLRPHVVGWRTLRSEAPAGFSAAAKTGSEAKSDVATKDKEGKDAKDAKPATVDGFTPAQPAATPTSK